MEQKLAGKKVAILIADGFEQVEMTKPRAALNEAGAVTSIVSPSSGKIQGMNHADKATNSRSIFLSLRRDRRSSMRS